VQKFKVRLLNEKIKNRYRSILAFKNEAIIFGAHTLFKHCCVPSKAVQKIQILVGTVIF
jgi:hypothetical protein